MYFGAHARPFVGTSLVYIYLWYGTLGKSARRGLTSVMTEKNIREYSQSLTSLSDKIEHIIDINDFVVRRLGGAVSTVPSVCIHGNKLIK
jgi:hypothetical protein